MTETVFPRSSLIFCYVRSCPGPQLLSLWRKWKHCIFTLSIINFLKFFVIIFGENTYLIYGLHDLKVIENKWIKLCVLSRHLLDNQNDKHNSHLSYFQAIIFIQLLQLNQVIPLYLYLRFYKHHQKCRYLFTNHFHV